MNKALKNPALYVLFILPCLILFAMFFLYPIVSSIRYSLTSWNGVSSDPKFIGFDNFVKALTEKRFWTAVRNNGYFILFSCGIQVPLIVFFRS